MKRSLFELFAVVCTFPVLLLAGCSSSFAPGPELIVDTPLGSISGIVHGGQQPIVGATVTAYETSNTAYGGASKADATATTDSTGFFTFASGATCTSGTVVYLYSVGGKPVVGQAANSAAGLMAVVGTCPGGGSLVGAAGGGSNVQIYMNEVSTVAAAYALAGFAMNTSNVSTDATHIGSASTTDGHTVTNTLAQTGIQNAGANAAQMYTAIASADNGGNNSGAVRAALTTTPAGNGTVPYKLINTLANILAACINSTGSGSSACTTLLGDARSGGGQTGTQPTDTATAAIYLAQHPYSAYVGTIYNIVGGTPGPFGDSSHVLTSAPTTFIVELIFSGGGLESLYQSTMSYPQTIAIDGSGNAWVANDNGNDISKFSPLGVSLAGSTGYTDSSCGITGTDPSSNNLPSTIAIATNGDAWIGIDRVNKVCVMTSTGGHLAYVTAGTADGDGQGLGIDYMDGPFGIALDASGNAWVTDDAGDDQGEGPAANDAKVGQLVEINGTSYTPTTEASGSTNGMNGPVGIAIQSSAHSSTIWVANFAGNLNDAANAPDSVFSSAGATVGNYSVGSSYYGNGIAIDSSGYVWTTVIPNSGSGGVFKQGAGGVGASYIALSGAYPAIGICVDGASNVWIASEIGSASPGTNDILEVNNNGNPLLPTAGYVPAADSNGQNAPGSPVVDPSGDVWYQTQGGLTLRELIGAAVPVATPIAYGVANNKLGTRP